MGAQAIAVPRKHAGRLRIGPVRSGMRWSVTGIRAGLLLLPSLVMLTGMWRVRNTPIAPVLLGLGVVFQVLVASFRVVRHERDRRSLRPAVYLLYGSAWAWT